MSAKINKRILILEDQNTYLYIVESLKSKFDDIIIISDYLKPVSVLHPEDATRLPVFTYTPDVTPTSPKPLKVRAIDKIPHAKLKDIDLGTNNAYFVVGKKSWYFLRDFQDCHIGLRNTNLDWQIVNLEPFSMGSNKFVFCHTMVDEHYKKNIEIFFNDEKLTKTVKPLINSKVLVKSDDIIKALGWATTRNFGIRFGLDYETNGLWRHDKYEDVEAIGVGIATKEVGFYLDFRYLSESELNQVKLKYRDFLDIHATNCWVFNIDFEMVITRKFLGEWAIYDFKDADIWRIILGDQIGYSKKMVPDRRARGNAPAMKEIKVNRDQRWSLKYTAQKYLNVESWDNEFEWLESKFWVIFNGFQHDNIQDFLQNPIVGNHFHQWVSSGVLTEMEMSKILKGLIVYKKMTSMAKVRELFPEDQVHLADELKVVMFGCKTRKAVKSHPYYTEIITKYPEFVEEFEKLLQTPKYFGNPFSIQPAEIVGKYCIIDSYYTVLIAEKHLEEDRFTHDPSNPDAIPAKWMTTEKMVDIFNGNKAIGAKLSMYGLYKSNTRRDRYNDIQFRSRVMANYIVAQAYYQMMLDSEDLKKHPMEEKLHPIFKSIIEFGGNPMDFGRATKVLFPKIYNPNSEKGWDDELGELYLGDRAEEIKEIMLDHKPGGFVNASAHSRALNLHKETATIVEDVWSEQDIPVNFDWKEVRKYYEDVEKLKKSKSILDRLNNCNIKGLHINEILKLDHFEIDGMTYTFREAITILKKNFFDINSNNEIKLGVMTERWKDYKTLLFLYHPQEYKSIIDDLDLWKEDFNVEQKVEAFINYMTSVITNYKEIKFEDWITARNYARDNKYPDELQNPNEEDMLEPLQSRAYLDKMLSQDLMLKHKVSKGLMDQYVWYKTIDEEDITKRKAWMLDIKHASPMSYKNWMQEVGHLGKIHDNLELGNIDSTVTTSKFAYADFDLNDTSAYAKVATMFRFYRKFDKLYQYLEGQLCKSDERLIGVEGDGVPKLAKLTLGEKVASTAGDSVKMYPQYEIMQKFTKRNSSGVHTIPSRNQTKSVIEAPEDSLLVYTDISGMELRGIAGISRDPVMIDYFEKGYDIKCRCLL